MWANWEKAWQDGYAAKLQNRLSGFKSWLCRTYLPGYWTEPYEIANIWLFLTYNNGNSIYFN